MDIKYHILDKHVYIKTPDNTFTVANDSENFEVLKQALRANDESLVMSLVHAENHFTADNIDEIDGRYYFRDHELPTTLIDKIVRDDRSSVPYINFWINRIQRDEPVDEVTRLFARDVVPIDTSGFMFAYTDTVLSGNEFFNATHLSSESFHLLRDKPIDQILQEYFGFTSKKLTALAKGLLIDEHRNLSETFFNVCEITSAYKPDISTTITLFQSRLKDCLPKLTKNETKNIAEIFKIYFKPAKLIKLINESNNFRRTAKAVAGCWPNLKDEIDQTLKFVSLDDLANYLLMKWEDGRDADYELNIEQHFPFVNNLKDKTVAGLTYTIPETRYQLEQWSETLSNCLDNYPNRCAMGDTIVIGLVNNDDEIRYAIEVNRDGAIKQFEGFKRHKVKGNLRTQVISDLRDAKKASL